MIEQLLIYQQADAKLKKIENKLSANEDRKKAMSAKKYLDSVEENLNKLDAKAAELAGAYESVLSQLEKLKEQESDFAKATASAETANETDYLIKKTDELLAEIKTASATASKIAEEMQSVLKEYATIKATTKAAQAQYAENGKKYNDFKNSFKQEKEAVEKELAELKKKVEPALMEKYLKKRANKIYPVVYEVNGNMCGACNMQLSMNELNRLKNGEIIECDQCGRILYQKQK